MATKSQAVSVTSTATQLNQEDTAGRYSESCIIVRNPSAVAEDLYLGGADVTTTNGIQVGPGTTTEPMPLYGGDLYGVVATGPIDVRVLEFGV